MLKPIVLALLINTMFAADVLCQPAATQLCQSDLPKLEGRRIAWFNLLVGDTFEPISAELFLRFGSLDAAWRTGGAGSWASSTMTHFEYRFDLPNNAAFPVMVTITIDGRDAATSTVTEPQVALTEAIAPNIFGAKNLAVRATDVRGTVVATSSIPLPDWIWLEREARNAGREAERNRRNKECGPRYYF